MIEKPLSIASDLTGESLMEAVRQLGDGAHPDLVEVHPYDAHLAQALLWELGWRQTPVRVVEGFDEGEWRVTDQARGVSVHSPGA